VWQQAIRHSGTFLRHVVPAIVKPLHALWNEVIGFLFLSFGTIFGFKTVSYIRQYQHAAPAAASGQFLRVVMAGACTLLMAWYGITSFVRARKISRS